MKKIFFFIFSIITLNSFAQVGINTHTPKASLEIAFDADSSVPSGVLVPRMTVAELEATTVTLTADHHGTLIFITDGESGTKDETREIKGSGFYHYHSTFKKWILNDTEPWMSKETNSAARLNSESIYQLGSVGVGHSQIDNSAQLDISASNKGLLIPRLTTQQRNTLSETAANGLMIFNTTTNCLNYWEGNLKQWLSLCGTYDPAEFNLLDCTSPTGPSEKLLQGQGLVSTSDTYTVKINVTQIGTYTILIYTANGYSYSKTGVFTQTGSHTIVLEGQGTPAKPGNDEVKLRFNGIEITPNCTLPTVEVSPASTTFDIVCTTTPTLGPGEYKNAISMTGSNYVEFDLASVTTPGSIIITSNNQNGISFSSNAITISTGDTKIRLYAQGTPTNIGTFTYNIQLPGTSVTACSFQIKFENSTGTFENPATSCLEILNNDSSTKDGYFWVQVGGSAKYKTYCDMSNGGWTLISSQSEKTLISSPYRNYQHTLTLFAEINAVKDKTTPFNEYNFRLPKNAIDGINKTPSLANPMKLRYSIKQNGHTGTTVTDIENSTVAPKDDIWSNQNYYEIDLHERNPFNTYHTGNIHDHSLKGKLFNLPFEKLNSSNTPRTQFDGNVRGNSYGFYSDFFTGFYGDPGWAGPGTKNYTYTYPAPNADKTFGFNANQINDIFGLYPGETQINHHIGTCSPVGDDFGGPATCSVGAYWTGHRPHNFNNNEGRILQVWFK
ncbi:hypothetical protein K5I29_04860 [Flavobacterium agricola]|uniref:Uncharacterized protein n=1 Tax=Flavobacterium agricola TaxID=2870839 RepID=A0ABY6M1C9_9FLAO|nr:fibrinogen-like YCDxxxxGGGW domain-containing protein [Flavobacterium agricola]UYW02236.1 hypothetical protein K5I29_04860 [Flavobacterium agricola]